MRRLADTLPVLRGPEAPAPHAGPVPFAPLALSPRAPREAPPTAAERSRAAQAAILQRTIQRLDRTAPAGSDGSGGRPARTAHPIPSLDRREDTAAERLAAAVAEARRTALADAEAAVAAARAEERSAAEAALAEARSAWAAEEAAALQRSLAEGLSALEARLSDALARTLAPLLSAHATERAVHAFADALRPLLREPGRSGPVTVKGPADLIAALEGLALPGVALAVADRPELVAAIGTTRIETALGPVRTALAAALAESLPHEDAAHDH